MSSHALPLFEVKGGPRERGRQQGEAARRQIHASLAGYQDVIPFAMGLSWRAAVRQARRFLVFAEKAFPPYVEELRGISEGAGVAFADVWLLNCYEDLVEVQAGGWGCTCLAVRDQHTSEGHVYLAHNEDWSTQDRENVYLVHTEPQDGPARIGMTYGPLLVNIGFNAEGIGVAINSVYATDGRVGVPRILGARAILDARTIGEAIRACLPKDRAGGYHYLLADPNGELYSVEASATCHNVRYGEAGWLAHTNHYLSARMQAMEAPGTYAGSHVRLNRARRLLSIQLGQVTPSSLQSLLRDHVNWPNGICGHEDPDDPPHERAETLVSLVMDLTERVLWAAPGPPCQGHYAAYHL